MKTLIIGGSGFVGSFLIKNMQNRDVQNLDKNPSYFFNEITKIGDIRFKDQIFIPNNTKTVVLLAAEHRDDISPSSLYYDVNVAGTKNVLEAMDLAGIKNLIFTSSVAIYGLDKVNPDENHKQDPFNHYGKSKWAAEEVIKKWFQNDPNEKSVTVLRPTVIFGERNRGNVYNLLKQISSGKFIMIGKGENKKSLAYVGNIVALIKNRIEKAEFGYHILNYADKPDFAMTELISVIESNMNISISKLKIPYWIGMIGGYIFDLFALITKHNFSISSIRIKKFCATTQFNADKVHTNFRAPFTLKEGLNKTLDHEFIKSKKDEVLFYTE